MTSCASVRPETAMGRGGGGGLGPECSAVQCGDIMNCVSLCKTKMTRTEVLLEEIMASHKPEWQLPRQSILSSREGECTNLIEAALRPAEVPGTKTGAKKCRQQIMSPIGNIYASKMF